MAESMKTLSTYLVLVFFAAQFVAYFKWSNLGIILAVKGANLLMSLEIGLIPLMILFILLSAAINMLMGSASAKWAILATRPEANVTWASGRWLAWQCLRKQQSPIISTRHQIVCFSRLRFNAMELYVRICFVAPAHAQNC